MSKLIAARGSQNVQVAELVVAFDDTMVDVNGDEKDMGAVTAGDIFKAINLPPNVEVIGGEVQVEVQGVGPTAYTVEIGTSSDGTSFAATFTSTVDLKGAVGARTALTLTGSASYPGLMSATYNDIYMRLIRSDAVATAGKFFVRVMFITRGKVNEAVPG